MKQVRELRERPETDLREKDEGATDGAKKSVIKGGNCNHNHIKYKSIMDLVIT